MQVTSTQSARRHECQQRSTHPPSMRIDMIHQQSVHDITPAATYADNSTYAVSRQTHNNIPDNSPRPRRCTTVREISTALHSTCQLPLRVVPPNNPTSQKGSRQPIHAACVVAPLSRWRWQWAARNLSTCNAHTPLMRFFARENQSAAGLCHGFAQEGGSARILYVCMCFTPPPFPSLSAPTCHRDCVVQRR